MKSASQKTKDKNEDKYAEDPYVKIRQDFMKKRSSYYLLSPDQQEINLEMLPIPILQE